MKFSLLLLSLLTGMFLYAQNTTLVVIGNGAPAKMTLADLKSVFRSEKVMWDNTSLALMKSATEPGKSTCSKVYETSCDDVTKFWLGKAMGTNPVTPKFFDSVSELQAYVAGKPGAIGIIDLSQPVPGVHVITINGKNSF